MPRDSRRAFERATKAMEPAIRRAFLQAIADVRSTAQMRVIEAAIDRGDIEGVLLALRLDAEFFAPLDDAIRNAFTAGAAYQLNTLPKRLPTSGGGPLVIRFQGRLPRAEAVISEIGGNLITEILNDQRTLVREAVRSGLEAGRGPRQTALDIVGRGEGRQGALIGLTSQQAGFVRNMRDDLETLDIGYFSRTKRDRRFDGTVRKAIEAGEPLSQADIARITGRYSDRLLKLRGDMIARTETIRAANAGRLEGVQQIVDSGQISEAAVDLVWDATGDARTRQAHLVMEDQRIGLGGAFISSTGARLRHPGDTSLGAQGEDVIGCRCYMAVRIDFLAGAT